MAREVMQIYFVYDIGNLNKEIIIPVIPQSLTYSYNPEFTSQQTLGRLTPIYLYQQGSDEIYNFSITLHRDMILESNPSQNLFNLVNDIKLLSYPQDDGGVTIYPDIYFELGEITAKVIVDTSISWQGPIIDGHYALVNIGFSIRVINQYDVPIQYEIEGPQQEQGIYSDRIYTMHSDKEYQDIYNQLQEGGYDTSIQSFVIGGYDNVKTDFMRGEAQREFNFTQQRLNSLYGVLIRTEFTDPAMISKTESTLKQITRETLSSSYYSNITNKEWTKLKKQIDKYFDEYWKHTEVTQDERDKIKTEFLELIETLMELGEEIEGYAASS